MGTSERAACATASHITAEHRNYSQIIQKLFRLSSLSLSLSMVDTRSSTVQSSCLLVSPAFFLFYN